MDNQIEEIVLIDKDIIGLIIGKGGKTINLFKENSGANIYIQTKNVEVPRAKLKGRKD